MYIKEAIDRADALLNNEYTAEEKLHWCDVVSAEINAAAARLYKRAELERYADGTFLLPEDCEFERVEKIVIGKNVLEKQDLRTHGIYPVGIREVFIPKKWETLIYLLKKNAAVIYLPVNAPIRRIELKSEEITVSVANNTITMGRECPFIAGDVIEIDSEEKTYYIQTGNETVSETAGGRSIVNVLHREAVFNNEDDSMSYVLTLGEGEAWDIGANGSVAVDMRRVITDKTVCGSPYDEMYIDYICAQICFYQRKHDVYQQHIARYNARMEEYKRFIRDYAPKNDDTVFRNWWRL